MTKKNTTNRLDLKLDTNALADKGQGEVIFKGGLVLSDESEQVNGTRYDHTDTDIEHYNGEVFADHDYGISNLVGTMQGVAKEGSRIVASGIKFAMSNPLGRLAYDLVKSGHLRNVSIGTSGPEPEDDGTYKEHSLHEVSLVGLGNNRNARIREVVANSLAKSKAEGMDVAELVELYTNDINTKPQENTMADEKKDETVQEDESKDESADADESTDSDEEVETSDGDADTEEDSDDESEKEESDEEVENKVAKLVAQAVKPLTKKLNKYEKTFNDGAKEPEWTLNSAAVNPEGQNLGRIKKNDFSKMDKWELAGLQFLSYCNSQKGDRDAAELLQAANDYNLGELKKNGLVHNTLTLGDFGNFVTNPELQAEIEGFRTDYSSALSFFSYQNTNSRDFSWLTRSGDISFEDVDGIDDSVGTDNLKPVKEYSGTVSTSRLQELAAVTPISTTANLFMAVDLIRDAAMGYKTEADRRFAQLPIARLEQAMEGGTSNTFAFDATGSDTTAVKISNIRRAIASISQGDGALVMSEASKLYLWDLLTQLGSSNALGETVINGNPVSQLWGKRVVEVPNDLLPTLDDSTTYRSLTYVRPLAGGSPVTVTVNHSIFYVDPARYWKGRTNGSLRYDLSTEASYESGGSTYSAFARNEVLLRGSIFRGGAITDPTRVAGLRAEAVIS